MLAETYLAAERDLLDACDAEGVTDAQSNATTRAAWTAHSTAFDALAAAVGGATAARIHLRGAA